jgi:hypothetical protein
VTQKCANPSCAVPFHRLGRGKLFRFEVKSPSEPCRDVTDTVCSVRSARTSVFFWLCDQCTLTRTLRFDIVHGLTVERIPSGRDYVPAAQSVPLTATNEQAV